MSDAANMARAASIVQSAREGTTGVVTPLDGERATIAGRRSLAIMEEEIINTPDGPMTWAEWKKKNPVQIPSRRTKGKKLPNKVKLRTDE
ncbi:MAG: hypothetical protein ABW184_14620 [Sphingobium sp.]